MTARMHVRPLLLALVLLSSGCAGVMRNWVEDPVYDAAIQYTYERPLEEVWPEVVAFMERKGYPGQVDQPNYRYMSIWKEEVSGQSTSTWRRFYVEGLRLNAANCRIRIFQNDMFTGRPPSVEEQAMPRSLQPGMNASEDPRLNRRVQRARQMEFELLELLEPEVAQALYEKHRRKGLL